MSITKKLEGKEPVDIDKVKNYVVGFVDLYSIVAVPFIRIDGVIRENEQYKLEPNTIPRWKIGRSSLVIAFEVKTEINSLGELIRQIRLYQKYSSSLSLILLSALMILKLIF